jgi:hypothetical protein
MLAMGARRGRMTGSDRRGPAGAGPPSGPLGALYC